MEQRPDVVDLAAAGEEGGARARITGGDVEEVDRAEETANAKVDVEGPAPGSAAVGKGATDDGTKTVSGIELLQCNREMRGLKRRETNTVPKPKVPPSMAK